MIIQNDKFKDSGIEWIGKIPTVWNVTRISAEFKVRNQKVNDKDYMPLSVTKLTDGIVPQLEQVAKSDAHEDRKLVLKGDFVINSRSDRKMSCGVSIYDGSVSLINIVLEPIGEISSEFTHYLFKNYYFAEEFYRWGHGIVADLWTTNSSDLKRIYIPVPSKNEQIKIVTTLNEKISQIDLLISIQEKQIEILNEYTKQIIFETLNKCGAKKIKLKYICSSFNSNLTAHSLNLNDGITKVYGASGTSGFTNLKGMEHEYIGIVKDGAGVGRAKVYPKSTLIVSTMAYIIPQKKVNIKWLCYLLNSLQLGTTIELTTIPHIYFKEYGNSTINYVNYEKQKEIVAYLDNKCCNLRKLIEIKQMKIENLNEYKKKLIYEYVTGKKRIK